MPDGKKMLGAFFGNLITGIGKKRYQDFVSSEQERLGEKQLGQERQTKILDAALEKFLDPNTPYMERVKWGQFYQQQTGLGPTAGPEGAGTGDFGYALPTPSPTPIQGVDAPTPGGEVTKPLNQTDFLFGPEEATREQGFMQKTAEHQKTLAGADAQTALAEDRRASAAATEKGKPIPKTDTAAGRLELDKLKTQFNQLNSQYDDLAKLIPKDIYGQPTVDENDPRVKALQRLDTERNNVYNKMYGGEKKTIPGF